MTKSLTDLFLSKILEIRREDIPKPVCVFLII